MFNQNFSIFSFSISFKKKPSGLFVEKITSVKYCLPTLDNLNKIGLSFDFEKIIRCCIMSKFKKIDENYLSPMPEKWFVIIFGVFQKLLTCMSILVHPNLRAFPGAYIILSETVLANHITLNGSVSSVNLVIE